MLACVYFCADGKADSQHTALPPPGRQPLLAPHLRTPRQHLHSPTHLVQVCIRSPLPFLPLTHNLQAYPFCQRHTSGCPLTHLLWVCRLPSPRSVLPGSPTMSGWCVPSHQRHTSARPQPTSCGFLLSHQPAQSSQALSLALTGCRPQPLNLEPTEHAPAHPPTHLLRVCPLPSER
jgi:hypothetical protein